MIRQEDGMGYWLVILIGLLGGAAVGIQSPIAGAIGKRVGGTASSFIIHLSGAIFSGILLLLEGGKNIREWIKLPWYMLGAGIFGLILYQTINVTMPRLGTTLMIALIIVGQLVVGIVIDQFGLFGVAIRHIDLARILGVVALLIGGYLISR
jgi:bacterial/archaeal transporter family-2 protein